VEAHATQKFNQEKSAMIKTPARASLKWAYSLVLIFSAVVQLRFSTFGRSGTMDSGAIVSAMAVPALYSALAFYRVYMVVRVPATLASYPLVGFASVLRFLGVAALYLGALVAAAGFVTLAGPYLMRWLMPVHTESGAEYFVAGLYSVAISGLSIMGTAGLFLFEFSRLVAFEQNTNGE